MSPGEGTREFYRQQGREQEQARIIALLEPMTHHLEDDLCEPSCYPLDCQAFIYEDIIKQIKGEK